MTMLLAVETSGYDGSLALMSNGQVLGERSLAAEGRRNAQTLVSEAAELLTDYEFAPTQVVCVAVSIGPGSFTGLRVGITFAKTFSWANDTQLVAVDTFRAISHQAGPSEPLVTVVSDAQRNELFVSEYDLDHDGKRKAVDSVRIETPKKILSRSGEEVGLLSGPGLTKHSELLGQQHRLAEQRIWKPTATSIAEVGWIQYQQNEFADKYELEPLYIRRSYAEEKTKS